MNRAQRIESTLAQALPLAHLEVADESSGHNVPAGAESHFKVVLVSDDFEGQGRVARHRRVNGLLAEEFAAGMHALAVHTYTPAEWVKRHGAAPLSPPCAGGAKS
ncbi:MAG: BolA/IbaG family iron-sulfur metabolism protein [Pseudomonadales bacterium]|nr:BolA/IbaG family iron-sulfur metabolism protein [Pseudomonadales bacterium]MCP5183131.1 BolA/IbaG family iron-sulfur metabolism protein [Pseudomonadales bacterium]